MIPVRPLNLNDDWFANTSPDPRRPLHDMIYIAGYLEMNIVDESGMKIAVELSCLQKHLNHDLHEQWQAY